MIDELKAVLAENGYEMKEYRSYFNNNTITFPHLVLEKNLPEKSSLLNTIEMLATSDNIKSVCVICNSYSFRKIFNELRQFNIGNAVSLSQGKVVIGDTVFFFITELDNMRGCQFDAAIVNPNQQGVWLREIYYSLRDSKHPIKIEVNY